LDLNLFCRKIEYELDDIIKRYGFFDGFLRLSFNRP